MPVRLRHRLLIRVSTSPLALALALALLLGASFVAPRAFAGPPEPAQAAPAISLEFAPGRDAAIERRIETIFAELETLDEVEVEVESGVVHLRGQVFALDAADEAESIARRVEGVVAVQSDVQQIHSLERRVRPLLDNLRTRGVELLMFLPLLLAGIAIVAGAWLFARLISRLARRHRKVTSNVFVRELVGQIVRAVIVVLGIVLALELMGATTLIGALLGTAGVVGLALGFAFRDTAENYIASILLSVRQPFEPNDLVSVDGQLGRVIRLTSRATILLTLDGNHVRIPNSNVFKGTITNFTRNPERRFSFKLGVSVEADLARVQELACATIAATPGVLATPPPGTLVEEFGDSAMIISISGWIDQREADWFKVGSEARRRIKVAFEQAGIEVPEPIYQIRTRDLDREHEARQPSGEQIELPDHADVSPDEHIARQIEEDRTAGHGEDLLNANAPIE